MGLPKFGGLLLGVFLIRMIIYLGPELRPEISVSPLISSERCRSRRNLTTKTQVVISATEPRCHECKVGFYCFQVSAYEL